MLIDTGTGLPYDPSPAFFLGRFDVYDREETLGVELNKYNPNDPKNRDYLIKAYCLKKTPRMDYRHVWSEISKLQEALQDKSYDFRALFEDDYDECISFPSEWNIKDPRGFFEEILKVAKEEWKEDLEKASKEDPSTW